MGLCPYSQHCHQSCPAYVYLDRAITQLKRADRDIPDTLSKHISPLSREHINLTGIYTWDAEHQMSNGYRSLRLPAGATEGRISSHSVRPKRTISYS